MVIQQYYFCKNRLRGIQHNLIDFRRLIIRSEVMFKYVLYMIKVLDGKF